MKETEDPIKEVYKLIADECSADCLGDRELIKETEQNLKEYKSKIERALKILNERGH